MIKYTKKIEPKEIEEIDYIECDCCHVKFYNKCGPDCVEHNQNNMWEYQEFLHVRQRGGYSSIFGDEAEIKGDFCQHCVKKLLGDYLCIGPNWIEQEAKKHK